MNALAETLQEFLSDAMASGLRVTIHRNDFTEEIRQFVNQHAGWKIIEGPEESHFIICPPMKPMPPPTEEQLERWSKAEAYPPQRTAEADPRGFWRLRTPLAKFETARMGRVST